jgi:phosphatidylinositol alpha-1,6-mannosyltransferase
VKPLKVLLVSPDYPPPPGGIQTIVRNLEIGLEDEEHEVEVLHVDPRNFERRATDFVPRPRWLYTGRGALMGQFVYLNAVYRKAVEAITRFEPDVVHAMHVRCWPAMVAAQEKGVARALTTYALELEEKTLAANAIEEADAVHAISEFTASLVRKGARREPHIEVIPPSIDVNAYREAAESVSKNGSVVTLARFVDRKNIETVIEAWSQLSDDTREGRQLIVAGDGPKRDELERRAINMPDVEFPGWVNGEDKRQLLARSDLFVMVPRRENYDVEGFGIVYIEAQAAGTPVVGSSHGGAPEAIGNAGIVVENENDPEEVADAIKSLLRDETRREEYRRAAAERLDQFDIPAVTDGILDVYRKYLV